MNTTVKNITRQDKSDLKQKRMLEENNMYIKPIPTKMGVSLLVSVWMWVCAQRRRRGRKSGS